MDNVIVKQSEDDGSQGYPESFTVLSSFDGVMMDEAIMQPDDNSIWFASYSTPVCEKGSVWTLQSKEKGLGRYKSSSSWLDFSLDALDQLQGRGFITF